MTHHNAILLEAVGKSYRRGWRREKFHAIQDINLQVRYGESVGFIGHNGAGKSSTIRIAMGLQQPTSGVARLRGGVPQDPASRKRVAYVPENPLLYDYLAPLELLRIGARLHGISSGSVDRQCIRWLQRFGIEHVAGKRIRQFSKGMTQRTALAYAMVSNPELLILDEPLSGLDPLGRREVVEILQEYRDGGGTMLFSSHILNDVEQLADRFVFIHQGRIKECNSPEDGMDEQYELIAAKDSALIQEGFNPYHGSQMIKVVSVGELSQLLSCLMQRRIRLISITPRNSLERTYLRLVSSAEENVRK